MTIHRISIAKIAILPEGPQKNILARKLVAAYFGFKDTRTLQEHKITTKKAVRALSGMATELGVIRFTIEPIDPSDTTRSPRLLIDLADNNDVSDAALLVPPSERRKRPIDDTRRGLGRRQFSRDLPLAPYSPKASLRSTLYIIEGAKA